MRERIERDISIMSVRCNPLTWIQDMPSELWLVHVRLLNMPDWEIRSRAMDSFGTPPN